LSKKKKQQTAPFHGTPVFSSVALKAGKTAASMEAALDEQHHLDFVVKWTKSKQLVLMSLAVRVPPDNLSVELLEHPMGGNTGELTVDMGVFKADTITISFIMGALTEVKKAATFVVEDTTHVSDFKPTALEPLKSLKQGENWSDKAKYPVGKRDDEEED
jgi:hypothetical protein